MTSLADELLADLEDLQDYEEGQQGQQENSLDAADGNDEDTDKMDLVNSRFKKTLPDIAALWKSDQLTDILQNIEFFKVQPTSQQEQGHEHPEYEIIVSSNTLVVDIENEILSVHKLLRDLYAKRFPELEQLVMNPLEYAQTVQILKNDTKISKYDSQLREILTSATVMVITVTSTTTKGSPLDDHELQQVLECCNCIAELNEARNLITEYVESRMNIIAPNLSVVVGGKTAAQLLGAAGGLNGLCRIPSCNVPMLGSSKKNLAGFSSANPDLRNGFLYQSTLISRAPLDFRKRLVRIVSAKVALAARVDAARETPDGALGRKFKAEIDEKVDKWQEPPPTGDVRALEAPLEQPKQRRGGKRMRKLKERYAVTDLQKQQNRMAFGVAEEEVMVYDESEGLGMINQSLGTGKIRASSVDNRVKAKVRQATQKKLSASQPSSGLSSLVFTPVQGMELVDPEAQSRKMKEINEKWFANNAKFVNVKKD